jgi:hypothetical protein
MFRSRIAEWSYQLGCLSAVAAIIYRVFWFGGLGARLFGDVPRVVPHNFMDLSILLFLISVASNAEALVRREDGKTTATGKAA